MSLQQQAEQAVEKREEKQTEVVHFINKMQDEIKRALPKHLDAGRMARVIATEVRKIPALALCNQTSFAGAMLTAATLGLEPGVSNECWLVPYKGEVALIIGYQGMAKLFYQHPLARSIDAQAVYADDYFEYEYGTNPHITHKPSSNPTGEPKCFYAVATLATGATHFCVLTSQQVRDLRRGLDGTSGGIPDPQHWMEKKTCIRQLFKLLPKSSILVTALDKDERLGSELARDFQVNIQESDADPSPRMIESRDRNE